MVTSVVSRDVDTLETDRHKYYFLTWFCIYVFYRDIDHLKGTKTEKLHAMHVKELIKTNYSEW